MPAKQGSLTVLVALAALLAGPLASADPRSASATPYDGHWWLLLTMEEKSGYLNGDADCNRYELAGKPRYSKSAAEQAEYITNFYRNTPGKRSVAVFDIVRMADEQPPLSKEPGGGDTWTERHGYWDGQWWREGSPADRLGFVEGYVACYARAKNATADFRRQPGDYAKLISQWYRLNEETADIDPARETDKIADVLFRFADRASGPR